MLDKKDRNSNQVGTGEYPSLSREQLRPEFVQNSYDIDVRLFSSPDVPVEESALDELNAMLELQTSASRLYQARPDLFSETPEITRVALTPDFHKAQGIPVGTVMATRGFFVPQAIGRDIGCGYLVVNTGLVTSDIESHLDDIERAFRHVFFQGGRDIPLSSLNRSAILRGGVTGLINSLELENPGGIWNQPRSVIDAIVSACRTSDSEASVPKCLTSYVSTERGIARDDQIGSIGGGNHFVELQQVERVMAPDVAFKLGVRPGSILLMVHSGSLSIGAACASASLDRAQKLFQENVSGRLPHNKLYPVPLSDECPESDFFISTHNAARNFAVVNRVALSLSAAAAISKVLGQRVELNPIYDSSHNYINRELIDNTMLNVHRKGASAAHGYDTSERNVSGEIVILPGAMGVESYIMTGLGSSSALNSASHGAGRQLRRTKAMGDTDTSADEFLARYRVVKPVDFKQLKYQASPRLLKNLMGDIKQEMPNAYKPIGPVMQALTGHGMAQAALRLAPLMTAKG
jgi:tRNA-splicing ligase RtcB